MIKETNIIFIGFMGSGKSLISKRLGHSLKRKVVSTDKLIEKRQKRSIRVIFKKLGEQKFRDIERKVIQSIAKKKGLIIDCGGGVPLNRQNMVSLRKNGLIVHLKASPQVHYARLKNAKNRPLLVGEDLQKKIKQILKERKNIYKADVVINTDHKSPAEICKLIIGKLKTND